MHLEEAIETMDMPRKCCINKQMQDNICILFTLILIPVEDISYGKKKKYEYPLTSCILLVYTIVCGYNAYVFSWLVAEM